MLANSNAYGKFRDTLKDTVAWLSTVPTSRLMYNPYFALKYQQKLQNLVVLANVQGRRLTDADKALFEKSAREFAIGEYRTKLNSFHKDMNYAGIINYILAFFPALIEQYRAYGKIALENPDFIAKAAQVTTLPARVGEVETDAFGTEYLKVALPFFMELVRGVDSIGEFQFGEDDIVRSKILKEIVKRYEEWKHSKSPGGTGNSKPKP
jgi:hypothetical protein